KRSFLSLTEWLEYDQQAAIGFLWLQKVSVLIIGNNEYALRLVPFIAGCIALWLMYLIGRRLPASIGLTALALFAFSYPLVYYTSEAKQYIVDVAIALGLLALFLHFDQRGLRLRDNLVFGLVGAGAIWFSHPAIFTLAGIGLVLLIKALRKKSWSALGGPLLTGALWLASFALFYVMFLGRSVTADVLLDFWGDAFLPLSARAGSWLTVSFDNFFHDVAGLNSPLFINLLLILLGLIFLFRTNLPLAIALTAPTLLVLLASAARAYPFAGRMILFLTPAVFVAFGGCVELLGRPIRNPLASAVTRGLAAVFLVLLAAQTSVPNSASPVYREHIRPTMEYLRDSYKDGDQIFVYFWTEPAFRYYAPKFGFSADDYLASSRHSEEPEGNIAEIAPLLGHKRVWFIFSHVYEKGGFNERDYILEYLDSVGDLTREFRVPGTSVYLYLYDLRQ
ncbi:MAG: glycosyltransferase family 39 protein, partial [Chloroflexota bacterium]